MSRQDANAAFRPLPLSSTAQTPPTSTKSTPATKDPASVDPEWQEFFKSLKDSPADVRKNAEGPSWGRDNWPLAPHDDLTSALDGNWAEAEKTVATKLAGQGPGQAKGERADRGRHPPGDPRFGPRPDADPRLPHARPFPRQSRSAGDRAGRRPRGARSALLRLHRRRLRPQDLPRPRARPGIRHAARDRRDLRAHLLPDARRRVHAHLQCRSRRPGSRSGSRVRTRRSASPARAGAPS